MHLNCRKGDIKTGFSGNEHLVAICGTATKGNDHHQETYVKLFGTLSASHQLHRFSYDCDCGIERATHFVFLTSEKEVLCHQTSPNLLEGRSINRRRNHYINNKRPDYCPSALGLFPVQQLSFSQREPSLFNPNLIQMFVSPANTKPWAASAPPDLIRTPCWRFS